MKLMATALAAFIASLSPEARAVATLHTRARLATLCAEQGDVLGWGQAVMPDKFRLPFCDLHRYIVSTRGAEAEALKAPRGHGKTVIGCMLVPLYQGLVEPKKPFTFYLNVQDTEEKALAINRVMKSEIEENQILQHLYGNQMGARWTDSEYQLKNGVVYKAVGAGVSIRGTQYQSMRPDYIMADDLYNEQCIHSPDATAKVTAWAKSTLYKTLARDRRTAFHVMGTAINKAELMVEMEKWPGCTNKTFAAETKGQPLWPELYTMPQLEEEHIRLGSIIYNRELLNICQDDSEAIVKSSWLTNWEYDPDVRWSKREEGVRIVGALLGCDPSTGEQEVGDPAGFCVAIQTVGPGSKKDWWIEALHNEVLSWDGRLAQLERMKSFQDARGPEYRLRRAYIEAIGGFKDFGNQAKVKTGLPIELVTWVKGKKANLAAKSGHFEFGRVHLSKKIKPELRNMLVEQLTTNEPEKDDLRDSVLLILEDPTISMKQWVG